MFLNMHLGSIDQMGMCKMPENALFCVAFLGETQPKVAFPLLPSSLSVRPSVTAVSNAYSNGTVAAGKTVLSPFDRVRSGDFPCQTAST